jgi:hypothetical protein
MTSSYTGNHIQGHFTSKPSEEFTVTVNTTYRVEVIMGRLLASKQAMQKIYMH